jgi:hypothetical protein
MSSLENNYVYRLYVLVRDMLRSIYQSVYTLCTGHAHTQDTPPTENTFWKMLDTALRIGPFHFWKNPTAVRAGRAIYGWIRGIFEK